MTLAVKLPAESLPNGLAFHGNDLYVSDSLSSVIWKVHCTPSGKECVPAVWSDDPLIGPYFGANGIAFLARRPLRCRIRRRPHSPHPADARRSRGARPWS